MLKRISGFLSALLAVFLWFTRGAIEALFFDKVVHEINTYTVILINYGPPILFATISIYLLGHGKFWKKNPPLKAVSTSENSFVPIYKAVEYIAERIGDTEETLCYPTTLNALRQQAAHGNLRMHGRKQLDTKDGTRFSSIHTDIPKEYWENSTLSSLVVSPAFADRDTHTNPETTFSWGPKGIHESNRYSSINVNWDDVLELWPK